MPTQAEIYQTEGDKYEALVAREDYQGNILKALTEIVDLQDRRALDLGAGSGRLTCLLAPYMRSIKAFDLSKEMLRVCRNKLSKTKLTNWQVGLADHRQLPVASASADLAVSGWSVSYLAVWNPDSWRSELEKWLGEMKRVLRPGSFIVLFESLGTGNEEPLQLDHLREFYGWLDETGFQNKIIRTDYQFATLQEAEELTHFFFGSELGDTVKKNNWTILPECTGVWRLKI